MPLKIAYITDERFPSVHTDTQQIIKTIDALGKTGARVDLIQPRMLRHLTLTREQIKSELCEYYNVEGHFHLREMVTWPASDFRIEKLTHGLLAPLKGLRGKYDVFYTRNLIPLSMTALLRFPVLFETYRALPDTDPWTWRVVKQVSKNERFLGISTHSEYSRQIMIENGIAPRHVEAIPNGFDPLDFANLPSKTDARRALGYAATERVAVYTGHIRKDKGIHYLLDMAEELPDVRMVIVGGNVLEVSTIQRVVRDRRLNNVQLTGQQPISKVPQYLAAADVLILPPTRVPLTKSTVLPMKTFTYMAAGRPILAPDLPDTAGVLKNGTNALKVPPDDINAAVNGLRELLNNPELSKQLAKTATRDARQFTWEARAHHLVRFIDGRIRDLHRAE